MTSESGVIICLHSIKTSADLLKRKRFTHGTLCSKSRSNDGYLGFNLEATKKKRRPLHPILLTFLWLWIASAKVDVKPRNPRKLQVVLLSKQLCPCQVVQSVSNFVF